MDKETLEQPMTEMSGKKLIYSVSAVFSSEPSLVWNKLTDMKELLRWDSMLLEMNGHIGENGQIKLKNALSPRQTFSLRVTEFVKDRKMVWSSGFGPLFKGKRSYILTPHEGGTHFRMEEVFSGLMLPLIKGKLPDCNLLFGTYIKDLKKELNQK